MGNSIPYRKRHYPAWINYAFILFLVALKKRIGSTLFVAAFLFSAVTGYGQSTSLTPNVLTSTPMILGGFDNLTVAPSTTGGAIWASCIANGNCPDKVIDATASNFARATMLGAIGSTSSATIKVTDGNDIYQGHHFAGFRIRVSDLSLGGSTSIRVRTLLGATVQDTKTLTSNLFLVDAGIDTYEVGLFTDKDFDAIEITYTYRAAVIGATFFDVFHAVLRSYEAAEEESDCNVATTLTSPDYPVSLEMDRTGTEGLILGAFNNPEYAIDDNPNTAATLDLAAGLGATVSLSIRDVVSTYEGGTFAGFDIAHASLVGLDLLNGITIKTYLDGQEQESSSATNPLISASLLSSGRQVVGFITGENEDFNEVQITFDLDLSVDLGQTSIYGLAIRRFCDLSTLSCNTSTKLTNPEFPIVINSPNTGVSGALVLNSRIEDAENIIDADATSPAKIILLAGALANGSISVKKGASSFPAGAFVGFEIARPVLADVGLLDGLTIRTFLNGAPTSDVVSEGDLVSVNSSILSGVSRRTIGFIPTEEFDEIQIVVNQTGVNLGTTEVYALVSQRFCEPEDELVCNTLTPATNPEYPVYVNARNTGLDALLCAACSLNDTQNLVDNDPDSYATIISAAGADINASISVANALNSYPIGSFAGFDIRSQSLIAANALGGVTIKLYLDGNEVQSETGSALLLGAQTFLSGLQPRQTIGIVAHYEFDEVQITFGNLAGLSLGDIHVYNAVVQNNCPFDLVCNTSYELTNGVDGHGVVIEGSRTGVTGGVGANARIENAWNVVSESATDYARIYNTASVLADASISVANGADTYPPGTFAGFAIKRETGLIDTDLFPYITISTYNNGQFRESRTGINLLDLKVIINLFGTPTGFLYPGFYATKSFDEIRISVGSLVSVAVLGDYIDVYGAFVDTRRSLGNGLSCLFMTNPDMNVGYLSQPITGDVSTNDINQAGIDVTYGPVTARGSNPTPPDVLPVLDNDGSYTFQTSTPGVYTFDVTVCEGDQTTDCPTESLTITVLDATSTTNPPVVNPDFAVVTGHDTAPTPNTIDVKANDQPGNVGGTLGAITISTPPASGTGSATVSNGKVVYTPAAGFYGEARFEYRVCEGTDPNEICGTAEVKVTVLPGEAGGLVLASDDYNTTSKSTELVVAAAAGVLANDSDSKGGELSAALVSPAAIPNVGTLSLALNGGYNFLPSSGFAGATNYVYEACNGDAECAAASLYFTVYSTDPLPVQLQAFTVAAEAAAVSLRWTTTAETNSAYFEVQHSLDARKWNPVGQIKAASEASSTRNYTFAHGTPSEGINYYRLKMVDLDGSSEISPVRGVRMTAVTDQKAGVFPNPAKSVFYLRNIAKEQVKEVGLYSLTGQKMQSIASFEKGIPVGDLQPGVYLVKVLQTDGTVDTHKLLINR